MNYPLKLVRLEMDPLSGTFGALLINGQVFCVTIERPWKDNEKDVSSIPTGIYQLELNPHSKFGQVWRLEGVPGRELVEIHRGNTVEDTEGCILVGAAFGYIGRSRGILASGTTLDKLMARTRGRQCSLEIKEFYS